MLLQSPDIISGLYYVEIDARARVFTLPSSSSLSAADLANRIRDVTIVRARSLQKELQVAIERVLTQAHTWRTYFDGKGRGESIDARFSDGAALKTLTTTEDRKARSSKSVHYFIRYDTTITSKHRRLALGERSRRR